MKVTIIKPKQIIWIYFILFGVNLIKGQTIKGNHSGQIFESNQTKEICHARLVCFVCVSTLKQ